MLDALAELGIARAAMNIGIIYPRKIDLLNWQ